MERDRLENAQRNLRSALVYLEHHGKGIAGATTIAEVHAAYDDAGRKLEIVRAERAALGKAR